MRLWDKHTDRLMGLLLLAFGMLLLNGCGGGGTTGNSTLPPVAQLLLAPENPLVYTSLSVQLVPTALNETGVVITSVPADYSWSSSNKQVATVSASGRVTGVAAGIATITAVVRGQSTKNTALVTVRSLSSLLQNPAEDPTKPGSIGGTLFTLALGGATPAGIIDQANNAVVTLTGMPTAGGSFSASTRSTIRGGYQFADVPAGIYDLTATVGTLTGELRGVRVRGNLPTLMTNLLMSDPAQRATLSGTVTQGGLPAAEAIISVDVTAYTTEYLNGNQQDRVSVILSLTTDAAGHYTFNLPSNGLSYYLAAHSATSMVSESQEIRVLRPGDARTVDLMLVAAESPVFSRLLPDVVSATLPAPTALASERAMITRLAIARALHAPRERLTRLEQLSATRRATRAGRAVTGIVENDLYWTVLQSDIGVRGFNVYRSSEGVDGPFTRIGSTYDPYQMLFFDNDPVLQVNHPMAYMVTSYAANAQESSPTTPIYASPLPPVAITAPDDGAHLPVHAATIRWDDVPGARSYLVLKFATEPSYNTLPIGTLVTHLAGDTSEMLTGLAPGDYWYSISAYDADDPNYATAAAYSAYRKITLE